ncbi:MAG: hypothetical protein COA45_08040 [Zetaproteobacteria bacterium]|nr:MAG: hypothetical protein COA45_08040 [Zetaproteobacteria bacterium]
MDSIFISYFYKIIYQIRRAIWRLDLKYMVDGYVGYADFSDDNARWDAGIAPRRSVAIEGTFGLYDD